MITKPILFDLPEVVETPLVRLQMPRAGYGELLHKVMIDGYDDCVKWLNWPVTPSTPAMVEEECRRHHAEFILRKSIRYLIIENSSNQVIGRCAFPSLKTNWQIPQFSIAYFIGMLHCAKGYATQATYAMTLLAFRVLKARKIEIFCDADNVASIRIPLKLGFELEYTQCGTWPRYDNNLAVLNTYSLFAESNPLNLIAMVENFIQAIK